MTTYTEKAADNSDYYEARSSGITWDSGNTQWDIVGNVATTYWDITETSYSEKNPDSPAWSEV